MSAVGPSPLELKIKSRIRALGPMPIPEFMALCLGDPEHGYYMTREPFGADGDFITAPEVSQMFGELIGAWLATAWDTLGRPDPVHLVELGPGRGTLMADILRTFAKVPPLLAAARVHLVEMSPRLRAVQARTLAGARPRWHDNIATLPTGPALVVANEFFDALPIHQYVRAGAAWRERVVTLDADDNLVFAIGAGRLFPADEPRHLGAVEDGAILEAAPVANAIATELALRVVEQGGVALAIDYGYVTTTLGDSLQAVARHRSVDVLSRPGEVDVTVHVNFEALARAARAAGAAVAGPVTQGDFLINLGLLQRAGRLGSGKDLATQERLRGEVERLAGPAEMGNLFKVMAITPPAVPVSGFA